MYNDHWGGWNWQKTTSFGALHLLLIWLETHIYSYIVTGTSLLRSLEEADELAVKQCQTFTNYSADLPSEHVTQWEEMVCTWNEDPNQPDPYRELGCGVSHKYCNQIQISLICFFSSRLISCRREAATLARRKPSKLPPHEVTLSVLLQVGLKLEEKQ